MSSWSEDQLIVQNYATSAAVSVTPVIVLLLDACRDWQTVDDIAAALGWSDRASLRRLLGGLADRTLLQRSDRAVDPREEAMAAWGPWNPAAGFFHTATRRVRYPWRPGEAERRLRRKAASVPMPHAIKAYRDAPAVPLPPAALEGELAQILTRRRTWRDFTSASVSTSALATLLGLTFGVQRRRRIRGQGVVVFKTSPSGGARHPIEAYVWAARVDGVPRGIYHYNAGTHALERLAGAVTPRRLQAYLGQQTWFRDAPVVVFMTAVFARSQWRYASPRAYRAVLLDAGHLGQTFCLLATRLQLAPFCTMALADDAVEAALGLDGIQEAVIYAAGVGVPKSGADAGAWRMTRAR